MDDKDNNVDANYVTGGCAQCDTMHQGCDRIVYINIMYVIYHNINRQILLTFM